MIRGGFVGRTGPGVLAGGDAAKEVCVRPPEESVAEGVGVGVLTAADVDKELCVMLSDEGAAEGVGVGLPLLG